MDEMSNTVVLNDEDGNEVEFELLDLVEYNGEEYVVMLPCDETADDGMVVILKLEQKSELSYQYRFPLQIPEAQLHYPL